MDQGCQIQTANRLSLQNTALLLLYNTLMAVGLFLAVPVLIPLALVSIKRRQTFLQRLGLSPYPWQSMPGSHSQAKKIWVHALSVGEVTAAQPLVVGIQNQHPDLQVVLTVSTMTGFQTASRLFAGAKVNLAYFPYDLICSVRAAADKIDACAVILVETDIWPNFLAEMKRRQVPVYLVNMRLSEGAWNVLRRFKGLACKLFSAFKKISVQTPIDARRLSLLGLAKERVCISGNIKFDGVGMAQEVDDGSPWQSKLCHWANQPIVVAGSTHEGEEQVLLDALVSLKKEGQAAKFILAPRDPERAQNVINLCAERGLKALRLSHLTDIPLGSPVEVIVVDFLGALKSIYSMAKVAFVGGSLVNEGGHNPLEPAYFGKPVVFGPDMSDFHQIAAWLLEADGARQVTHKRDLALVLSQLMNDDQLSASMGSRAKQVVLLHQGAVAQTLEFLDIKPVSP